MQQSVTESSSVEARYDPETLRKVIALAGRLQQERNETLTASEVEAVGEEVGLDPAYVREALAQVEPRSPHSTSLSSKSKTSTHTTAELCSALFSLSFPVLYGALAYLGHRNMDLATICTQVIPAPLAALLGFISGRRKIGLLAGATLAISLAATYATLYYWFWRDGPTIIPLTLTGAWLGWMGGSLRERYFPLPSPEPSTTVSRPAILDQLAALEARLESGKQMSPPNSSTVG